MEPIIAIIISAVVLLLQVVSLIVIARMRKTIDSLKEVRTNPAAQPDHSGSRSMEFRRQERRPMSEHRPRQGQNPPPLAAGPAADPVEKSLRDINMKLKNAERDQEVARRRLQENFPREEGNRDRGDRDRGSRDRGDRNRDDRGGRGPRDRDQQRGSRRDNWQDRDRNRNAGVTPQQAAPSPSPVDSEEPVFTRREPPVPPLDIQPMVQESLPEPRNIVAADYSAEEALQHGRKIIVKRRPLKDEAGEGAADATSIESAPANESQPPASAPQEPQVIAEETPPSEVHFGRGRR